MREEVVIVVGAGPAGLATSACLNLHSVPNIVLEREDCVGSLFRNKSYDCLHIHLPKQYCELPHMSFPSNSPMYVPRSDFIRYLDDYASRFKVNPVYHRSVESATFDQATQKWHVKARNTVSGETEDYVSRFLVVATGENSDPFVPEIEGLDTFKGELLHSTKYKSGAKFSGKSVLVVGSGNSGMEIAFDAATAGAKTSIIVRSPLHILSKNMLSLGLILSAYLPVDAVDTLILTLCRSLYGDLSKYGLRRPEEGPFYWTRTYGKYPNTNVGAAQMIKSGKIQVLPSIASIKGDEVILTNGKLYQFDAIILATGFKRSTNKWLKLSTILPLGGDTGSLKRRR
ncbi:PREDICTED: probable indole-3-pyruvate monooxygenase YUCCA10 isoform X2 [Nelumbo nucifera]|uniref:indole-3-pyruvate monooxygenase n=1 Tax=Nelumbo nucifera TaxID=4432 RepID=A0A1U7Z1M0_NELNU|nr:PREDICTED: probable indole-3-pyruvate monooxygenase YUCCA10 isoform X2 [Nelumbo nucifera]